MKPIQDLQRKPVIGFVEVVDFQAEEGSSRVAIGERVKDAAPSNESLKLSSGNADLFTCLLRYIIPFAKVSSMERGYCLSAQFILRTRAWRIALAIAAAACRRLASRGGNQHAPCQEHRQGYDRYKRPLEDEQSSGEIIVVCNGAQCRPHQQAERVVGGLYQREAGGTLGRYRRRRLRLSSMRGWSRPIIT